MKSLFVVTFLVLITYSLCDTPANCTYDDIVGIWEINESERRFDQREECPQKSEQFDALTKPSRRFNVTLEFPDKVTDEQGNLGTWTLIYNQGFEIIINYRKYFAFSKYKQNGTKVTSFCHQTMPGYSHDVLGHNWACWRGQKVTLNAGLKKVNQIEQPLQGVFRHDQEMIKRINEHPRILWKAKKYDFLEGKSTEYIMRMKGGKKSKLWR